MDCLRGADAKQNADTKLSCKSKSPSCSDDTIESRPWWMAAIARGIISDEMIEQEIGTCDCMRSVSGRATPSQYRLGRQAPRSDF